MQTVHQELHRQPAPKVRAQKPLKPQHAPHKHREITYGAKVQLAHEEPPNPPLNAEGVKRVQAIVGEGLFYGRAVDNNCSLHQMRSAYNKPRLPTPPMTPSHNSLTTWLPILMMVLYIVPVAWY